jgi:hypothetical protein
MTYNVCGSPWLQCRRRRFASAVIEAPRLFKRPKPRGTKCSGVSLLLSGEQLLRWSEFETACNRRMEDCEFAVAFRLASRGPSREVWRWHLGSL